MSSLLDDADGSFLVLANAEGQHSLWPVGVAVPAGWLARFGPGSRRRCLEHVDAHAADRRPAPQPPTRHGVEGVGTGDGLSVVLASTASDSHTWNLVYLQLLLREWGNNVTNLGPCTPDALLLDTCRALRPDLVVISSVNGHGFTEGRRVIRALRACPGLRDTPVAIGGLLGTGAEDAGAETAALLDAGFDLVADGPEALTAFRRLVGALAPTARC